MMKNEYLYEYCTMHYFFHKTKALIMGLDVAKWKRCNSLKQIALEVVEIEFF